MTQHELALTAAKARLLGLEMVYAAASGTWAALCPLWTPSPCSTRM